MIIKETMTNMPEYLTNGTDPLRSSVISASAGTGKTWLLIARILRLLLNGVTPESILAITFTNKATYEMYERLTKRVRDWADMDEKRLREELTEIGASPELVPQARTLFETLLKNEPVRITTFHSFCIDIVRLFPFDAEIPLNFTINDESGAAQLYDEALRQLYDEVLNTPALSASLDVLTAGIGLKNTRDVLWEFLQHRNDWRALTLARERNIDEIKCELAGNLQIDHTRPLSMALSEDARAAVDNWMELLQGQKEPLKSDNDFLKKVNDWLRLPEKYRWDVGQLKDCRLCFVKGDGTPRHKQTDAQIKRYDGNVAAVEQLITLEEQIGRIFSEYESKAIAYDNWKLNAAWYDCGERLLEIYQTLQRRQRCLDFDDLEWHARRLFNRATDAQVIQSRLGTYIRHVLIDEFQDTSPEQWLLIKPLLEEIASQKEGGSIFIVGDVKQSIYGFRRSNPDLLEEAAKWLSENLDAGHYGLDHSYRSSVAVIDFVNKVFDTPAEKDLELGGFRRHETHRKDTAGTVGLLAYNEIPDDLKARGGSGDAIWQSPLQRNIKTIKTGGGTHEAEAGQLAAQIKEIKRRKNLNWRDFMVLVRQRTHILQYEAVLRKHDIPVFGGQGDSLIQTIEADDITALLRFIVSPQQRHLLSLCQVLRSPLFCIGDEDLRVFMQTPGNRPMEKLKLLAQAGETVAGGKKIWSDACRLLDNWIKQCKQLPPHDLLHLIYEQRDVIHRYRAATRADHRNLTESRLLALLHLSLDFQSGRYPHIAGFIEHLETLSEKHKIATDLPADADFVSLLTIHGAKGLEAEVVFLADCGPQKRHSDTYSALADWPAENEHPNSLLLLPATDLRDEYSRMQIEKQTIRQQLERANLLYVAITRARDSVFVSGSEIANAGKEDWYHLLQTRMPDTGADSGDYPDSVTAAGCADDINTGINTANGEERDVIIRPVTPDSAESKQSDEINPGTLKGHIPGRHAWRGKVIHRALQLLGEGVGDIAICALLRKEAQTDDETIKLWFEEAQKIFRNKALREVFDDSLYVRVFNEMPIWFTYEGRVVSGRIDRVCVSEQSVWLIDYKTHVDEKRAKADSAGQMRLYRSGAHKIWPDYAVKVSILLTQSATLYDY